MQEGIQLPELLARMAEEDAPPAEEAAPATQAVTEPPAIEAPLPEATVVEGEYPS
jgi:hypothetical protein